MIEEDAFKDLTSLMAFEISESDIEELPRIISNSPRLTSFSITNSQLALIRENAFSGVPSLEELNLSHNEKLSSLQITDMANLTSINVKYDSELLNLYLFKL